MHHTLAVLAVDSTLVYCCYDLRPKYDTKKYFVREEWNLIPATSITRNHVKKKVYAYAMCSRFYCRQEIPSWYS